MIYLRAGDEIKLRISVNFKMNDSCVREDFDTDELARVAKDAARNAAVDLLLSKYDIRQNGTYESTGWLCKNEGCIFNMKDAVVK